MSTSPIPEHEQALLRRTLVELRPLLLARASILCRRLRPPPPAPEDVVNEMSRRLLARYRDHEVQDARGLAFTAIGRIACDVARGYRFDAGVMAEPPDVASLDEPRDPFVRKFLAALPERERCVLLRIVVHDTAVIPAFQACGWETASPFFEYKKLLGRLRAQLEARAP